MKEQYAKAMQSRITRLSEAFQVANGRLPTVEEIGELVSEEMRQAQKKSRQNYSGDGGLRSLSPERRKEIASMGGRKSKRPKAEPKQ